MLHPGAFPGGTYAFSLLSLAGATLSVAPVFCRLPNGKRTRAPSQGRERYPPQGGGKEATEANKAPARKQRQKKPLRCKSGEAGWERKPPSPRGTGLLAVGGKAPPSQSFTKSINSRSREYSPRRKVKRRRGRAERIDSGSSSSPSICTISCLGIKSS